MDLNNWIIKDESSTDITYYGYSSQPGISTDTPKWVIIKESINGDITTREIADNDFMFDKIWDDKEQYFTEPTTAPTLLFSGATIYENGANINARWEYQPGMTKYFVSVYDKSEKKSIHNWNFKRIELNNKLQIVINVKVGYNNTYEVVLTGKNGKGEISTSFVVTV